MATKTVVQQTQRVTERKTSSLQWFLEECSVCFYLWTFGLSLWTWAFAAMLLYAVPWARLPLLMYITFILWSPSPCPFNWPAPLRNTTVQRLIASYFPMCMVKTAELSPNERYIFAFHPHGVAMPRRLCCAHHMPHTGILAFGAWCGFATNGLGIDNLFPGIQVAALTIVNNLRAPFLREYLLLHRVGDVSKRSCLRMLSKPGRGIMIVVGGATEALLVRPGRYDLCLRRRKGFVKLALQTGASLVPVISFGENDHYDIPEVTPQWAARQRALEKRVGFTLPAIRGQGLFWKGGWGLMPRRVPTTVVVGAPLPVKRFEGDMKSVEFEELVAKVHARYVAALQALWEKHKDSYAPHRAAELTLVE